jgi:ABC-type phosphate transport system substrate-binding protein
MKRLSARQVLAACAISAASLAALVAPGAASAATLEACSGSNTFGAGSSLQSLAQEKVWAVDFNSTKDKSLFACNGKNGSKGKPTITYESIGSGAGYKKWKETEEYGKYGYVGTDNTINQSEIEAIEKEHLAEKAGKPMTIPVLQAAVAVVVHLPAGCTSASNTATLTEAKSAEGRLVLTDVTLEKIYSGEITKWNQINSAENGGDKLTCESKEDEEAAIHPVVRKDKSGTTHVFKKYLGVVSVQSFEMENGEKLNWNQVSEGGTINVQWPKAAHVTFAKQETGPGVLEEVNATPGSIGYAVLADSRETEVTELIGGVPTTFKYNFVPPTGGKNTPTFWVELEDSSKISKGKAARKYADPATNFDVAAKAESNCKSTIYQNGTKVFPPPSVFAPWNEVTGELQSKTYSLCGLTYDLALTNYTAFKGGTVEEATTVQNYLNYILDTKGGQADIKKHDFLGLPTELLTEAKEAPALIED